MIRWLLFCICQLVVAVRSSGAQTVADGLTPEKSPAVLLQSLLFDEKIILDSGGLLLDQIAELPPEEAFSVLQNFVLPEAPAPPFRLSLHVTDVSHPQLRSPALELIAVARQTGRLIELLARVDAARHRLEEGSPTQSEVNHRCDLSLRAMLAIAAGDLTAAGNLTTQLHQRCSTLQFQQLPQRLPETLLLMFASDHNVLHEECIAFLATIVETQIRAGRNSGPIRWDKLVTELLARNRWHLAHSITSSQPRNSPEPDTTKLSDNGLLPDTVSDRWQMPLQLKHWSRATRRHSWSSGQVFTHGFIDADRGAVRFLSRYDDEYLFFNSPLRGPYVLECFCSSAPWANAFPFVVGSWLRPGPSFTTLQTGGLYRADPDIEVSPRLSRTDDWTHYRISVTSDRVVWFLNGRPVYEQPLSEDSEPWVAIHNPSASMGEVRDVRIIGQPTIPTEIRLSEFPVTATQNSVPITHVPGWAPWHEDPWHSSTITWTIQRDASGESWIHGSKNESLKGAGLERLLRYHWPLLWDCTIDFEFFYQSGSTEVHPALGSTAIMLRPGAVTTHQITDGFWEAFGRDPLGESTLTQAAADSTDEPITTPHLIDQQWNHCRLELRGSRCLVYLNQKLVFDQPVAANSDRTFGLFHYGDQTESRVKNIVLRGDWPTSVPSVNEQELQTHETQSLDQERSSLMAQYDVDFTTLKQDVFRNRFNQSTDTPGSISLTPKGLQLRNFAAPKKGSTTEVTPRTSIAGDFDIIAEYADLELDVSDNGSAAMYLGPRFSEDLQQWHLLYHGMVQHPDTPRRGLTQVEVLYWGTMGFKYSYPKILADDSRWGRIRLARRGSTIHYLTAPMDSPAFRLIHSMEYPDEIIASEGLMLRTSCYSQGTLSSAVNVTWKKLSIRANSIGHLPDAEQPTTTSSLCLLTLDTNNQANSPLRYVLQVPSRNIPKWPEWSGDGQSAVVCLENSPGDATALRLNFTPDGNTQVVQLSSGIHPSLSPDSQTGVIELKSEGIARFTVAEPAQREILDPKGVAPQWSPDGKRIAWLNNKRLVIFDTESASTKLIPPETATPSYLAIAPGFSWSPDSSKIAAATLVRDNNQLQATIAIYDLDSADEPQTVLTGTRINPDLSWHPDGDQILFSGYDPESELSQLFVLRLSTQQTTKLQFETSDRLQIFDCDWSPDGTTILFVAQQRDPSN